MKKVLFIAAIIAMTASCASKKATTEAFKGDVEVEIPCTGDDYRTDKDTFRASGMGYSTSMNIAKSKALLNARAELATSINSTMKRVLDNYASSYEMGEEEEAKTKFQDMARSIVNQQLQGTVVICEKMMKTQDGKYRAYVCVELGGPEVINKVNNSVSDEDKLRIDYEYEKFKKVFEDEMSKL